ncbi:MAG: hypothetical protein AAGD32_15460 [Planctomycetota bacterium]
MDEFDYTQLSAEQLVDEYMQGGGRDDYVNEELDRRGDRGRIELIELLDRTEAVDVGGLISNILIIACPSRESIECIERFRNRIAEEHHDALDGLLAIARSDPRG